MKKILALVLVFCLTAVILPAGAEDPGSLLTLFGNSGGEGVVQGVAGTVSGGESELDPDSLGSTFGGIAEDEKIYSGDGEDALAGLGNIVGGAGDELSGSDSMFGGSRGGFDLGSLGSLLGGDGSGFDLGGLGSLLGGDGSGIDLGSLGSLLGGDGSGLNLGSLLGGGEAAPVNTVPAENPEQFYGMWEISSLRVGGHEIGMDMLKQFGVEAASSLTAVLTADSVSFAETNGRTETRAISASEFSDGALTITVDTTPARLQLTDTGNLLCTVSAAQFGLDVSVDIIFVRVQ